MEKSIKCPQCGKAARYVFSTSNILGYAVEVSHVYECSDASCGFLACEREARRTSGHTWKDRD
jgi:hypothetical protein